MANGKIVYALLALLCSTAFSDSSQHGDTQVSASESRAGGRPVASSEKLSSEEVVRRKQLNEAVDADNTVSEGREKLQVAARSFWDTLSSEQQSELTSEISAGSTQKLDALLGQSGLVLSSKEKRERFVKSFQTQLVANLKTESSKGLTDLIKTSAESSGGNQQKRQEQLAAKEALRVELDKNRATVEYLKKYLGWSSEESLLAIKRVDEQSKLLANGTPKEKAAAQDYLYRVFGPIYGAGMKNADKPSNAITELFANSEIRESAFGKIGRPFVTGGMGVNFTSKENPYGACAGVECARDFIADALTRSPLKGNAKNPLEAVEQFEMQKTFPATIKTADGKVVPTITDEGIQSLANLYAPSENGWLGDAKEKVRVASGLDGFYEVDKKISLKSQQALSSFLDRPEVQQQQNGATIWVSKKDSVPQADGSMKEVVSGHVVTMSKINTGSGPVYLVRDPNIKGLSFDAEVSPTGKLTYSYSSQDGKKTTFEWDNFFPSPGYWETESQVSLP